MPEPSPVDTARTTVSTIVELVKAAGETDEGKVAAKNLGAAVVTITKAINNTLLPLAAVNLAIDKAREYFGHRSNLDMQEAARSIPPSQVVDPKPVLAGPAINALAYSLDEPDLKSMYLKLLVSAMTRDVATRTLPSFVEVIKQLSPQEARLVKQIAARAGSDGRVFIDPVARGSYLPMGLKNNPAWDALCQSVDIFDDELSEAYYANLIRLGILTEAVSRFDDLPQFGLTREYDDEYDEVEKTVIESPRYVSLTSFGKLFIATCVPTEA